jgi:hypothetical protein
MSDYDGEHDPREMSPHFFSNAVRLDYASAVKADVARQNYTVVPRYWYVDATFACPRCGEEFCFSAAEQRHWYEELGFYVDSLAKHCAACRAALRARRLRRQEYDRDITSALSGDDLKAKQRVAAAIDELCETGGDLPNQIHANRRLLGAQIDKRLKRG